MRGHTVVIDIGKTLSKVSLWAPGGQLVERWTRTNAQLSGPGYRALDAAGIEDWLAETLSEAARRAPVAALIPVAHGAGIALVREGRLLQPPMDYENPMPAALRERYDAERDAFALTGSPALPDGLNIGAQLYLLESLNPAALREGTALVTWPQYWAWRLSGVASTEVTTLGCHSDLWCPASGRPSPLAERRGWAARLAPLRAAGEVLGALTAEWVERTGLPREARVYCGLHDSNAALLAARAFGELAGQDATVLSTGTWFVAMRSPTQPVPLASLPAARDCLVNVDAFGQPVPSARFMGGREIELLTGIDARRIDIVPDQPAILAALPAVLRGQGRILPTFVPGCGPFPHARGRWVSEPAEEYARRAAVGLYAALTADVCLDLIGTREKVVIEGRFAQSQVFIRALATLRKGLQVYVAHADHDVSFGALRLIDPQLSPAGRLEPVTPLALDLDGYRDAWRRDAEQLERAA